MPGAIFATRAVPSRNGFTWRTSVCVVGSRSSTVNSRLAAGNPRIPKVRSVMVAPRLRRSVPEWEIHLPEKRDVLADLQRDRLKHDLVVQVVAGEQAGLGDVVEIDRGVERGAEMKRTGVDCVFLDMTSHPRSF